jgi:AraC-like DNA-binding protein
MKIYRKLLASYLCVCLIPLLLSMYTIIKLQRNVQSSIIQDRESVIHAVQSDMDQKINDAMNTVGILSEEALITRYADARTLSPSDVYDLCKLIDVFSAAEKQQSAYDSSFCYFYRTGFLVSNQRTYHSIQNDLFAWELQMEPDDFLSLIEGDEMAVRVQTVIDRSGNGKILVLRNVYDDRYREVLACVGLIIQIDEHLLDWYSENSEIFVTDTDGTLLYGSDRAELACAALAEQQSSLMIDGEHYLCSLYSSGYGELRYGYLVLRDSYYAGIHALWRQMLLELVIYFSVGVIAAVLLSKQIWMPFQGVLPYIEQQEGTQETDYPSLQSFAHAIKDVAEEKVTLENRLGQVTVQAQHGQIAQYLTGQSSDPSALSRYIEDGQPYRLMIFKMLHPEESGYFLDVSQDKRDETLQMLAFATQNILEEVLLDQRDGVVLNLSNDMILLAEDSIRKEDVEKAVQMVEKALSVPIACYISDSCLHLTDAPDAWDWVQNAYQNDTFWQHERESGVWYASDLLRSRNTKSYDDFLSRQQKLGGYLAGNNYPKAQSCLETMIREDLSDRELSFEMVRHRCANVVEVLLPHLQGENYNDIVRELMHCSTVGQMQEGLVRLFAEIPHESEPETADSKNLQWAQQVQAYIRANYRDPALNASMIADHLNMNLSTFSRRYKNTVGHGVLDEVHMVRLAAAKKLLEAGQNVRETAEQTGYVESRAMIRAFKRYEGITPGQYAGKNEDTPQP